LHALDFFTRNILQYVACFVLLISISGEPALTHSERVDYQTSPDQYRHWQLKVDGQVATLFADFDEDAGLRPGYKLKLNSYDLGVDIELNDAVNRIRFEHPQVRSVVITSRKDKVFCSGANIFMLGISSHAWKVNFCKFTNETRNGLEDSSRHDGLKFIAAVNGACAGGGYELALACDRILLIDDRSSAVSLPEVPLLGVLPGTGGLTRITDKRRVRHDLADVFCTTSEGVRGQRARDWRLVDDIARPAEFDQAVRDCAEQLAADSDRPLDGKALTLGPLDRSIEENALRYSQLRVEMDRASRTATFIVNAPNNAQPSDIAGIEQAAEDWYPLVLARELEDAILSMRSNELELGTWIIKTEGDASAVLQLDDTLLTHREHWLVRATIGYLRRSFARLDVSARSLFAVIDEGSCFAGSLLELALACDRSYQLALPDDPESAPNITLSEANFGLWPMVTDESRLQRRFYHETDPLQRARQQLLQPLDADGAFELGLVTSNPDDLDWEDEIRIAIEERVSMSPDALTAMEANLRFNGRENLATRIFGRLTAWQNWIFQRPNAVGENGALKVYGSGDKARFDWDRV
jgi:benzoyl-CoA-dihydrodiol lyase